MSYHEKLIAEIEAKLASWPEDRPIRWVAHEICNDHGEGLAGNDDAEFWRHGGYCECRRQVTKINNKHKMIAGDSESSQPTLPGFEYVQQAYIVNRDGEEFRISAFRLTEEEIDAKAAEYRKMGDTCFAHADELQRFKVWRRAAGQAAQ